MKKFNKRRTLRALGLFSLLVTIYFITYTGQVISTDELKIYDAAHSFAMQDNLQLTYTSELLPYWTQPDNLPVRLLDTEPMQAYTSAPLMWIAAKVPGLGLMQTAWMLNIFVTAFTAVILFYFGVLLGYRDNTALITALIFGLATMVWPYTQVYFREPLFAMFLLGGAYAFERCRRTTARRRLVFALIWLIIGIASIWFAIITKQVGIFLIPSLVFLLLPGVLAHLRRRSVLIGLIAVTILILVGGAIGLTRLQVMYSYNDRIANIDFIRILTVGGSYMVSPGFSIWAFSPILLAGISGAVILVRQKRPRIVIMPLVLLLSLIGTYSLFRNSDWYSGTGWGPRYMLPAIPFLALWLLPIADLIRTRALRGWKRSIIVGLVAQSLLIQVIAVIVPVQAYGNYLANEGITLNRPINQWDDGAWNPLYIAQVVNAHQSSTAPTSIAWAVNNVGGVILPLCVMSAIISIMALTSRDQQKRPVLTGALVILATTLTLGVGLRLYYYDFRFGGDNSDLWKVIDTLGAQMKPTDALLLNNQTYQLFFMNYYKQNQPVYRLPNAPGERLSLDAPPRLVTPNPEERAHRANSMLLSRLALTTSRWWYLTEYSPYASGRLRVTEYWLTQHYFASDVKLDTPEARLLLYAPVSAPETPVPPWPEHYLDADFGPASLVGYDLPHGQTYHPGDMLPVSLLWHHANWPADVEPFDYSVNITLLDSAETTKAQHAAAPVGSFGLMSQWRENTYYRDNHALDLPATLTPGDYTLVVLVFDWRPPGKNLTVRTIAGKTVNADHVVLAHIHIE